MKPTIHIFISSFLLFFSDFPQNLPKSIIGLFKASNSTSLNKSKKQIINIYLEAGENKTLYCGCIFDSEKNINSSSCGYVPKKSTGKQSQKLEWEHIMPADTFSGNLQYWKK